MANIQTRTDKSGKTSYRVQVRIKGYPAQSATFSRLTDAKQWAQQTETDIRRGKHFSTSESKKHTMEEAINRYFKDVLEHRKNPVNQKTYLNWWKKELGAYRLYDVKAPLIIEKRNGLVGSSNRYGRTISKTTANRYTQALGHVFTTAKKEWGWIKDNPVENITKFKEPRGRVRFLDDEERANLLEACKLSDNPYLYIVVVLALSTGARKMEILSLTWKDVNLKRGVIVLHETKNDERRTIPLAGYALSLVKEHKNACTSPSPYLFTSKLSKRDEKGNPIYQPIDIRTAWENAVKNAKIEDFRFHDLRHSAASYLAMNGATLAEIAEVLGHKTLSMVKRYAHLSEAHTITVVSKMNESIFKDG